jgi:serine/threonine-protein kinase
VNFGRYEVIRELGRGGMATVYLAHDPAIGRDVAIKVLPREFTQDDAFRARFQREARAIGRLRHTSIVQVFDFGEEDGQPFLVMDSMQGGSLLDRLRGGPLQFDAALSILRPVAEALDAAHEGGVIHRDVKPANILFDDRGLPHLADFGISRLSGTTVSLTHAHSIGTPSYMSPEQCEGSKELTGASDLYSLAVVAFQMFTGRLPFTGETPFAVMRQHIQDDPPAISSLVPRLQPLDAAIAAALAKDPAARPLSARAWVDWLGHNPVSPGPPLGAGATVAPPAILPAATPGAEDAELPAHSGEQASQDLMPSAPQPTAPPPRPSTWDRRAWIAAVIVGLVVVALVLAIVRPSFRDRRERVAAPDTPGASSTATRGLRTTGPVPATYTVVEGDTCFKIAVQFQVPADTLQRLNPTLDCSRLMPGQVVRLR